MRFLTIIFAVLICSTLSFDLSSLFSRTEPPVSASEVDLTKYSGTWYEIARLPLFFERHCYCSTATYTAQPDGSFDIENSCRWKAPNGELQLSNSRAVPTDSAIDGTKTTGNFEIKYSSVPFSFTYKVLALDKDYQYAMVGTSKKSHLWILSKTKTMSDDVYYKLVDQALAEGFDVSKILMSYHGPECSEN